MRRIVIIAAVVLSAVPPAVKAVPGALASLRGTETTDVALVPSAPAASASPSEAPVSGGPAPGGAAPAEDAFAAPKLQVKKAPAGAKVVSTGECRASFYGEGQATASGEPFDPEALTAAHRTFPFGSRVRVVNENNDEAVVVRINDRGPFTPGRCLDLSTAAMRAVGGTGSGVIPVRYELLAA
ncbi:septal ring lytic transglycosylase RlpA family protein [Actinocorallia longicatena]|uniref:Probable endolytic peptidoglycan transglycosylase RlpA n=1 Tax=Actinocorallia longicatena TaxID=111803 RepID=A0ABP6QB01_9ACTN